MLYIILAKDDIIMIDGGNDMLLLPSAKDLNNISTIIEVLHSSNDEYVVTLSDLSFLPQNFKPVNIRFVLNHININEAIRVIYYQQLFQYYLTHVFCGECGNKTIRNVMNKFVSCNNCNKEIYPHIAPCIMVRIHKDDKILMARGVNFPPNRWGLIAGFVEIGESLEEAVIREVKEEVGIKIGEIKYWGSQPWTFPSTTLMVGFTATYVSGELKLDETEIVEAGFFGRNDIPGYPSSKYSIARKLIDDYLFSNLA